MLETCLALAIVPPSPESRFQAGRQPVFGWMAQAVLANAWQVVTLLSGNHALVESLGDDVERGLLEWWTPRTAHLSRLTPLLPGLLRQNENGQVVAGAKNQNFLHKLLEHHLFWNQRVDMVQALRDWAHLPAFWVAIDTPDQSGMTPVEILGVHTSALEDTGEDLAGWFGRLRLSQLSPAVTTRTGPRL